MVPASHKPGWWSLLAMAGPVLAAWVVLLSGCRSAPPPERTPLPTVELDTPQAAAHSLLLTLRAYLDARGRQDVTGAAKALTQAAERIAAGDLLVARVTRARGRPPKDEGRWLRDLVQNWATTVAYYRDLDFDHVVARPAASPRQQEVLVPAAGVADRALIRMTCIQADDGGWRVEAVDFAAGHAPGGQARATGPGAWSASRPSTAP